ncbi:MAG: cell division protein ZapA [Treponema sp.]|jgi:cell division protein ZapA|nr:cell division protein ZapA [Treponema sp.]
MAKGTLQINLLGTSFSIQADEDSLYLEKLLSHYRKTVEELIRSTELKEPLKIAILAGIMITDELAKERQNIPDTDTLMVNAELSEAEKIVLQLTKKIDQVL